ncbi:MAG: glucan biosynthesis protein G [Hydrogenophaga sp.]|uniref:glucan biosynthesis protein n=1 Tax=Hydrogenophaga sp. TaxID=1904254 RepID=UPI00257B9F2F|nr:glucan biosynthesis protein G [Hydrogenophaga sp.]MBL0944109.1 glucan biosynthesis protein G [Hydrogenophaga sp.]
MPRSFLSFPTLRQRLTSALFAAPLLAFAPAHAFDWDQLTHLAQVRASEPWRESGDKLPEPLASITYDQLRDIRFRPERATWRDLKLPFEAQYFHLGLYQTQPVRIHELMPDGSVRHLPYRTEDFHFGANRFDTTAWGDLGHAGFRLHYPLNNVAYKDELVVFLGASYFRALGAQQQYGLSARGLAVDTAGGNGEEFPRFSEFWMQRPAPDAKVLTVFALLESPRVTGAYRFDIRPGFNTTLGVRARLFARDGAAPIKTLGVAPLTSMFLSGENQPMASDFRPEVHDSDGLMLATGEGEWLWRPLQRPATPQVSSFTTTDPRGFGLMQRDRRFSSYEDVEARYERRPSAWITPRGAWGAGRVELVQLPTPDETHDNIVAYWVPAQPLMAGQPLEFAYDIAWQGDEQQRPPSSWVTQSRRGHGYTRLSAQEQAAQPQYVLDFAGPAIDALPPNADVRAVVSANANGRVIQAIAYPNPATRSWRVSLRVTRIDPTQPVELRAFLQHQQHTVSETWTHLLLPE